MTPDRRLTLLELLRAYPNIYASSCYWLGLQDSGLFRGDYNASTKESVVRYLRELREECERVNLEMTTALIDSRLPLFEKLEPGPCNLHLDDETRHICDDLQRELSLQLFVRIRPEHRKLFDSPLEKWETVVGRFEGIARDVEEMGKCFALCRYTAAMFHALQVAELGAIELGGYIGVTDPQKGWGATQAKLKELVSGGRANIPTNLAGKFDFVEQMNQEVRSMCQAWRHKVDHAANHLAIVPNTDFTPDVAEHIMGAVRMFMLRLVEEMP
jgi:hypothetical protein